MIERVVIENFRCFEHFELEGLARVNLFGGMNNSGKTALLEGIYLGDYSESGKIENICFFRNDKSANLSNLPIPFKALFLDATETISIKIDNAETLIGYGRINDTERRDYQVLQVAYRPDTQIEAKENPLNTHQVHDSYKNNPYPIVFIPSNYTFLASACFENFVRGETEGKQLIYLNALQVVDKRIQNVRSIALVNTLQVEIEGRKGLFPISTLGDAANRLASIMVFALRESTKVILIDEIENGLHYSKQEEFWALLFRLAIEQDIQIIANTHSLEMIQAYNAAIQKHGWGDEAKYFEMYRDSDMNKIEIERLDTELLDYRLKMGRHLRGEVS